jgi:Arc/MetJ family transcription regulator
MTPAHAKSKPRPRKRGPGRPSRGWTRTNVRIDRAKLQNAQRILGLTTATETIDAALDAITFRQELIHGIDRLRAAGGLTADSED